MYSARWCTFVGGWVLDEGDLGNLRDLGGDKMVGSVL